MDSGDIILYVDKVPHTDSTPPDTSSWDTSGDDANPITLFNSTSSSTSSFKGTLDDIVFSTEIATAQQIEKVLIDNIANNPNIINCIFEGFKDIEGKGVNSIITNNISKTTISGI